MIFALRRVAPFRLPAPVVQDAAVVLAVVIAITIAITVTQDPPGDAGARSADPFAYSLGGLIATLLFLRRRWPLLVLAGSAAILMVYYALDFPGITPALPLAVALYGAAVAGYPWWAWSVALYFVGMGMVVRLVSTDMQILPVLADGVEHGALLASVVLLGEAVRSRRIRLDAAEARLARVESEREWEAARQVAEERMRIARDIHDVLAHTVSAIAVQAGYAEDILPRRPEQAQAALRSIRTAAREATDEVRMAVGVLRTGDTQLPRSPAPGLDQIEALLEVARRAGIRAEASVSGTDGSLPRGVEVIAYRIAQEAITNTIRHAHASTVSVEVRQRGAELLIDVRDDGCGPPGGHAAAGGHGLTGMIERAAALRGTLRAGAGEGGGFHVHARLPVNGGTP